MRNCLGGISSYFSSSWKNFSSSCLSCLSCFGSPQNNSKQEDQEGIEQDPASNTASNPASNVLAEVVFVSPVPKFNQAVDAVNDALDIQKSEAIQSSDPQNLIPQTQTSDAQTQTLEIEISGQKAIELENIASKEQDIIDQKNHEIKLLNELKLFNEFQIGELTASLRQLEARLNLLENSKQGPMREPEPEKENQTQKTNFTSSPFTQERPTFGFLQDSSSRQICYSDYKVRDIDSSSQWGHEEYKMISPLIYQAPSTIEGLQDFSDSLISSDQVYDSFLENQDKYSASNNSQSSTGSLTQSTETNISYFLKDDKAMKRKLDLLQNASTDAVDGVSDFSEAMDAITKDLKDLKEAINGPLYPNEAPHSPSPSPYSTLRSTPRVLDYRVLGREGQLVSC